MKYMEVVEEIDLEVARKINLSQGLLYEVLPLYKKQNKVYIAENKSNKDSHDLLRFLFREEICYKKFEIYDIKKLISIVLDYDYKEIENTLIKKAILSNASDIHFEPFSEGVNIRFRINGELQLIKRIKKNEYERLLSRIKLQGKMDITERKKPQDGKLNFAIDIKIHNCRLSTIPVCTGEKLVIRVMYEDKYKSNLSELNFNYHQIEKIEKIINKKGGLVIINGPTGSGKSSTLYTVLEYLRIKNKGINITTLEDPIEVTLKNINQMSLDEKFGITFSEGLKHILRQDPDIIMIGEIRDKDTAKIAVRASLTGHLVLSTLHSLNGSEVYLRLIEMGVTDYLLRDALIGIISQRLVRILCPKCKKELKYKKVQDKDTLLYKRVGCDYCIGTGYIKRSLVSAVHFIGKDLKDKMRYGKNLEEALSNTEMKENLYILLAKGEIDYNQYLDFLEGEEL